MWEARSKWNITRSSTSTQARLAPGLTFLHTDRTSSRFPSSWTLTRSKEMQHVTIHRALGSEYDNEELMRRLERATDSDKIALLQSLEVSDEFFRYILLTIQRANKVVNFPRA